MSPAPATRRRAKALPAPVPAVLEPASNGVVATRWFWYLLSFFIPMSGILIALFLYDQETREARKVGRNCLLIGFLIWVVFPFLFLAAFFFLAAFALIGWIASLMPAD